MSITKIDTPELAAEISKTEDLLLVTFTVGNKNGSSLISVKKGLPLYHGYFAFAEYNKHRGDNPELIVTNVVKLN